MDRKQFEKAYEPNPHKSPFTEVEFDEVAQVYKPLDQFNPRIASSLNAAWYGWRIRQVEVDQQQAKVEEQAKEIENLKSLIQGHELRHQQNLSIKQKLTRRSEEPQKQINSALEQIEKLYAKAESDYEKERNPYYDGMLSALDLAEQAIRGELEEQALKGEGTPNLNIDEKGECRHFSTTMFHEGKAECFHCDAVVNEDRKVIGKQKKAVWTVSKVKTFEETWDLNNKKEGDQ